MPTGNGNLGCHLRILSTTKRLARGMNCQGCEFNFLCNLFSSKCNLEIDFHHSHSPRYKKWGSFNTVHNNYTGLNSVSPKFMSTWDLRM